MAQWDVQTKVQNVPVHHRHTCFIARLRKTTRCLQQLSDQYSRSDSFKRRWVNKYNGVTLIKENNTNHMQHIKKLWSDINLKI